MNPITFEQWCQRQGQGRLCWMSSRAICATSVDRKALRYPTFRRQHQSQGQSQFISSIKSTNPNPSSPSPKIDDALPCRRLFKISWTYWCREPQRELNWGPSQFIVKGLVTWVNVLANALRPPLLCEHYVFKSLLTPADARFGVPGNNTSPTLIFNQNMWCCMRSIRGQHCCWLCLWWMLTNELQIKLRWDFCSNVMSNS